MSQFDCVLCIGVMIRGYLNYCVIVKNQEPMRFFVSTEMQNLKAVSYPVFLRQFSRVVLTISYMAGAAPFL